ncbi:MAG: ATP-binding protein [Acidobacteriota bacterium]
MTETLDLSLPSKLESAETVSSEVKIAAAKIGFEDDDANWVELAVHEAVINAITHGNKHSDVKKVEVKLIIEDDALTVYIRDKGEGFDPTQLPDPTDVDNLLKPSGRGIFYMRTFMDEVEHSLHPEGGTIVRLKKWKRQQQSA